MMVDWALLFHVAVIVTARFGDVTQCINALWIFISQIELLNDDEIHP